MNSQTNLVYATAVKTAPPTEKEVLAAKKILNNYARRIYPWLRKEMIMLGSERARTKKLSLRLGFGVTTAINMKTNAVGIGMYLEDAKETIQLNEKLCEARLGHEMGHENYTDANEWDRHVDIMADRITKDSGGKVKNNVAKQAAHMLFNICEDGRIETAMSAQYNFAELFKMSNLRAWKEQWEKPADNYNSLTRMLIMLSVLNLNPKWFKTLDPADKLRDISAKVRPLLNEGVVMPTTKELCPVIDKIYQVIKDYLLEALEEVQQNQDLLEELMKFMKDAVGTNGGSKNEGSSSGSSPRAGGASKGQGGEEEGDGKGKGSGKEEGEEGEEGDGKGSGDGDGKDKSSGDRNSSGNLGDLGGGEGNPSPDGDNSTATGTNGGRAELEYDEEAVEEMVRQWEEEVNKNPELPEPKELVDPIEEIENLYASQGDTASAKFVLHNRAFNLIPLPSEIRAKAGSISKAIEKILNARAHSSRFQKKGRIDPTRLARYATGDYSFFKNPNNHNPGGVAAYICWDNSGSMHGPKQAYSGEACALIEAAFKNIPMKIIGFTTAYCTTDHYLVKDFDEHAKGHFNYSYSFAKSKGFNGGNKDGFSIRVCVKELQQRSEKRKILIVLSDGLPSDYPSGSAAQADVRDAVQSAVKNGIEVISVFFGSADDRARNKNHYLYMYGSVGARAIDCDPAALPTELAKCFTKIALSNNS